MKPSPSIGELDQELYRALFEASGEATLLGGVHGRILAANPAAQSLLGMTELEIRAAGRSGLFDPSDPRRQGLLEERSRTGESRGRLRLRRGDGSLLEAEVSARTHTPEGGAPVVIMVLRDLSQDHRLHQELLDSEERLRAIFAQAPVSMARVGLDGSFQEVNDAFCRFLGYPRPELTGLTFMELTHPDDLDQDLALAAQLRQGVIDRYNLEKRYLRKDGQVVWGHLSGAVVRDRQGEPSYFIAVVEDITERKRTEQALAITRRDHRELLEAANSIIIRWDNQGRIRFINDFGLRFFGYTREELVGQDVMTIVPQVEEGTGRDLDAMVKDILVRPELYQNVAAGNIRKDGEIVWVTWTNRAIMGPDGEVSEILAIGNDISALKETEEALKLSEAQFRSIIDNAPFGMHMYELNDDGDLVFIGYNPAADQILGLDNAQYMGRSIADAFPEIVETEIPEKFREIARRGGCWRKENIVYRDDKFAGAFDNYNFQIAPGKVVTFFVDVSERQRSLERLQEANRGLRATTAALRAANEDMSQFTYAVSHDLKAPLRAVKHYAAFLREDLAGSLGPEQEGFITGMGEAVAYCQALIDDLLALSRVSQVESAPEAMDLAGVVEEVWSRQERPPSAELILASPPRRLTAERTLVRQVLANLIANALKFNHSEPIRVEVGWRSLEGGGVEIYVKDNGMGIAPRYHEKVFGLFQRLHTAKDYPGTGLGLAIVKRAVAKLGGTVRLESQEGQGATFHVTLREEGDKDA